MRVGLSFVKFQCGFFSSWILYWLFLFSHWTAQGQEYMQAEYRATWYWGHSFRRSSGSRGKASYKAADTFSNREVLPDAKYSQKEVRWDNFCSLVLLVLRQWVITFDWKGLHFKFLFQTELDFLKKNFKVSTWAIDGVLPRKTMSELPLLLFQNKSSCKTFHMKWMWFAWVRHNFI